MVTGVILAAGGAHRIGKPKQLLPLGGKPMISHVVSAACQVLDHVILVTGAYEAEVRSVLEKFPLEIVYNEQWVQGQGSSVKKAVEAISKDAEAVVFLVGDQPLVDEGLLQNLLQVYHQTKASIVLPRWRQRPGNPVIFDLGVWRSALLQLMGDEGARQIIRDHQEAVHYLELENEQVLLDVDTAQDYEMMARRFELLKNR